MTRWTGDHVSAAPRLGEMMKKVSTLAPGLVVAALTISACGSSSSGGSASGGGGSASQTINIGFLANLTGPGSAFGVPFSDGLKLALQEIDSSGALKSAGVALTLDTKDTGSVEANAVTLFNKFAQSKDPITISDSQSPIGLAIAPIANSQKVLFLSGAGSKLPNDAGYAFHLADLGTPMKTLGTALAKNGLKRVATIVAGDNPSFATLAKATEAAYQAAGGSAFVGTQTISSKDTDFSSILTNLRQANPDAILISALPEQSGNIIRQMKQLGGLESAKVVGTIAWGPKVYDVAQSAAAGVQFASVWAPGSATSSGFESAYKAAYNATPIAYSALGYETGWLIAAAISDIVSKGGSITSTSLKDDLPAAASSALLQKHGVIPGFAIAASGAATYPGALSEFGTDGTIKAVG